MYIHIVAIFCLVVAINSSPIMEKTGDSEELKGSCSGCDQVLGLLRKLEVQDQFELQESGKSDQILYEEQTKGSTPPVPLSMHFRLPSSDSSRTSRSNRVKRKVKPFYLFQVIPYTPEEIPWSNQAYKNPGVYGGAWGTQHYHPPVVIKD